MSETQTAPEPTEDANPLDGQQPQNDQAVESKEGDAPKEGDGETKPEADADQPKELTKSEKRIAQLTARNKGYQEEIARRDAELEKLRASVPKPAPGSEDPQRELERRAEEKANAIIQQRENERRQADFNKECDKVAKAGKAQFGEEAFNEALTSLWEALGKPFDADLVEAAIETGNPHQVLYKLGNDPDEAERIGKLSPSRKGAALAKLAAEAPPAALTPPPQQSRAPAPVTPLKRGGGSPEPRPDGNMDDFTKWYEMQKAKAGR